jgi:hypothetical protein
MAISDTTTFLVAKQELSRRLGFYEEGQADNDTDNNSTTQIIDTRAGSPLQSSFANNNAVVQKYLYVSAGTNSGSERQISSQTQTLGKATVDQAMAAAFTQTSVYHLTQFSNDRMERAINKALRRCRLEEWYLVTEVTDGDMRASGVTNWTALNSATLTKVTNAQDRIMGPQALRVANGGANGAAQSATIDVAGSTSYRVEAVGRTEAGTADLIAHDVTNDAEIDSVSISEQSPHRRKGRFRLVLDITTPATCAGLAFKLAAAESSADVRWNYIAVYEKGLREFKLSTEIEAQGWIREFYWELGFPRANRSQRVGWFAVNSGLGPGGAFRVALDTGVQDGTLWVQCEQPFPEMSGDTDTTYCNKKWLMAGAVIEILRTIKNRSDEWEEIYLDAVGEFGGESLDRQPRIPMRAMMTAPYSGVA